MPQITSKKGYNSSYLDKISISGLFLRSKIPPFQKSIASHYVTIKKIFSYTIVQPKVTNVEYSKLKSAGFIPLELTSGDKMCDELMKIIAFANSTEKNLNILAREIFEIRVKELKYILANTSQAKLFELNKGFEVLDKYLEFIAE